MRQFQGPRYFRSSATHEPARPERKNRSFRAGEIRIKRTTEFANKNLNRSWDFDCGYVASLPIPEPRLGEVQGRRVEQACSALALGLALAPSDDETFGLNLLDPRWPPGRAIQSTLRYIQHLLGPGMDLASL